MAREAVRSVFRRIGIEASETDVEKHARALAELMGDARKIYDPYKFTVGNLEITIHELYYEPIDEEECFEECHGYITVQFEVDGDVSDMRRIVKNIVKKMLKDIGADKYVQICE
jgi:hypothetical protein